MADITVEKKEQVQSSWGLVRGNMRTNAADFFLFFFKRHPDYQRLFHDFKDVKYSELEENQKFRGHAVRVFFAISSLVDNLDDLNIVVDILQKTVKDHTPRGIKAKHYEDLFSSVLAFLEKALGDKFTPACKGSWQTVAGVVLSVIHGALDSDAEVTSGDNPSAQGRWTPGRTDMGKSAMGVIVIACVVAYFSFKNKLSSK